MPEFTQQLFPDLIKEMHDNKEKQRYHALQTFDLSQGKIPIYPPVVSLFDKLVMLDWITNEKEHKNIMFLQKNGVQPYESLLIPDPNFGSGFVRRPMVYINVDPTKPVDSNPTIPNKTSFELAQMSVEEAETLYNEYLTQYPQFPDYWDTIWKMLLIANFAYYFCMRDKKGIFTRHRFLEEGGVLGMVEEWFDYKAYRSFVDNNTITNTDLAKRTFNDLSTRGSPLVYLTGIWHSSSLVGPEAFDFLTKEEINLYHHQERNGVREFKLKSKLTGEITHVHALGHVDREHFTDAFEFIDENVDMSLIELNGRLRYAKSFGLVKNPIFIDLDKIHKTLNDSSDKNKTTIIKINDDISLTVSLEELDEAFSKEWMKEHDYVNATPEYKVHMLITFNKMDVCLELPHNYIIYSLVLIKLAGKFGYIPGKLSIFTNVLTLEHYFEMDYTHSISEYRMKNFGSPDVTISTHLPTTLSVAS